MWRLDSKLLMWRLDSKVIHKMILSLILIILVWGQKIYKIHKIIPNLTSMTSGLRDSRDSQMMHSLIFFIGVAWV